MNHSKGARMIKKAMLLLIVLSIIGYVALSARAPKEYILQTSIIDEASGIARGIVNDGILWTHNDSGGKPHVYAIDSKENLRATLVLDGVKNRDWEDIASATDPRTGKVYLYVGEIGDNGARYPSVTVYKVEEPRINNTDSTYTATAIDKFEINYEDGARDAEALFIDPSSQDIYIISKREEQVGLYRIAKPSTRETNIAKRISTFPFGWVTAADISGNGKKLLVKTYTGVWQYKLSKNKSGEFVLNKKPKSMPYMLEPQGEAICYDSKGKAYFTLSEAGKEGSQILYYYK